MRASKYVQALCRNDLGRNIREFFAHESCIVADDQAAARSGFIFQISTDRFGHISDIRERKFICDDRSPTGSSKLDRHWEVMPAPRPLKSVPFLVVLVLSLEVLENVT